MTIERRRFLLGSSAVALAAAALALPVFAPSAGAQSVVDLGVALNVPPAGSLNGSIPGYVGPSQPPAGPEMQIPEPSTLALLLAGGLTLLRRRF